MHIIVGLGNPGREYVGTRHNVGFEVVGVLARRHGIDVRRRTLRAVIGDGHIGGNKVLLVRPMTFMNLSGEAVGAIARMYRVPPECVIVVVDDMAIPLGRLRLRLQGSAGGHHGLESIESHLSSRGYPRIRIGVGAARGGWVGHVLGQFRPDERDVVSEAIVRAADAVEEALASGFEKAMNLFNSGPEPGGSGTS